MILLIATVVLAAVLRLAGAAGVPWIHGWRDAIRIAMGLFFCATGTAHFLTVRSDLINMVPPGFPDPALLVTLSGVAEVLGGIGLLIPTVAAAAAWFLILLLIVVFPANIHAAHAGVMIGGYRHPDLLTRTVMQVAWIGMLWWSRDRAKKGVHS